MDTLKKGEELLQEESLNQDTKNVLSYERIEVENTPFIIIQEPKESKGADYTVTLGRYSLGKFESLEEAKEDAVREDWNRLIQVIMLVVNNELKDK